jgi:hypothetical protein
MGRRGRLGNQMFQYATLYSIAKRNNYEFGIPFSCRNAEDDYRDLCLQDCFSSLTAKDSTGFTPVAQIQENTNLFIPEFFNVKDNIDLFGYFQTDKYFKHCRDDILKEFTFNNSIKEKCKNLKQSLNNEVISIHMRFGDYEKFSDVYPRPTPEYYSSAFDMLPKNATIVLFSDDLNKASLFFKQIGKNFKIFENLNKFEDMCLMTLCDYHIMANSSFSWWGAWLGNSKKTIAPKAWYGNDSTAPKYWDDIYCEDWVIL